MDRPELTDVTLRDGLQMESQVLSTQDKLRLLRLLARCQYSRLEITSFVNPKWVPQFADADAFATALADEKDLPPLMAFVPNEKGLERLLSYPIAWAAAFVAVSEAFNRKNVNQSVAESLAALEKTVARARAAGRHTRVYISTVFGCPYQGPIADAQLERVFSVVSALGPDEIALGDTIGVAVPAQVRHVLALMGTHFDVNRTALHFHNTYGLALAAAQVGYECGVRLFDGATGGVGGCPYAKGASGNVATEELAYAFYRQGILPDFPQAPLAEVLVFLRDRGLGVRSHLFEILHRGGQWYGLD